MPKAEKNIYEDVSECIYEYVADELDEKSNTQVKYDPN